MRKIFFLILMFSYCAESKEISRFNSQPDSLENYFPLELGNTYQYFKRTYGLPSCFSSSQYTIDQDTVIDQKRYFWVKDIWLRMELPGKLFYYNTSSNQEGVVMDFSLEAGQKLGNKTITSGNTEVFGKIIPWKGFNNDYYDPWQGIQSYGTNWGYGIGKIYEYSFWSGPGTGPIEERTELIQFVKNENDSIINFSYDYYPKMVYTPVDTIMSHIFNMSIQVDHYYSYIKAPCSSFQFIESITIESYYKHLDSIIINAPLKVNSNRDSINFSATYTLDTLLLKKGFEFYYRIQAKDKGVIPHYAYKPDTDYYKVICKSIKIDEVDTSNYGGKDTTNILPHEFALSQNYPNPFNPETNISYQLPVTSKVSLKVYDVLGNEVAILVNEEKPAGKYQVKFKGSSFSSGVYFYQLRVGQFVQTMKFVLLK
ncbi:MAG: T9SS type A sorting domain-containing protein [Ignavibacteriaceae bacterium]|nr:T9SS type A sorting domain-containing protein [Ignavibacteriaceae bacterium]